MKSLLKRITYLTSIIGFMSLQIQAAEVLKSNAKQAIISLDELEFSVTQGDQVLVQQDRKNVGKLEITQISGKKAKANILQGKAPVGGKVLSLSAKKSGVSENSGDEYISNRKKFRIGAQLGYLMDSQTTTLSLPSSTVTEDVSQTGTGYAVKAFGDMPISGNLFFEARAGIMTFNVSGTAPHADCSGTSTSCSTQIMYLDADALVKYKYNMKSLAPFVEAGVGILLPVTKSSTALSNIPTISVFMLDVGAEFKLGTKGFLPVYFEYALFPPSNQVKTSYMGLVVGYGINF